MIRCLMVSPKNALQDFFKKISKKNYSEMLSPLIRCRTDLDMGK